MTTPEVPTGRKSRAKETKDTTFRCPFCNETKPLDSMKNVTRYFPPLVVCRECENKLR